MNKQKIDMVVLILLAIAVSAVSALISSVNISTSGVIASLNYLIEKYQ